MEVPEEREMKEWALKKSWQHQMDLELFEQNNWPTQTRTSVVIGKSIVYCYVDDYFYFENMLIKV